MLGLALSSAIRVYIQYESDREFFARERDREQWELDNFPEGEVAEMVELLVSKDVPEDVAFDTMSALSKYSRFFVDLMMVLELKMQVPEFSPIRNGACILFFLFFVWSLLDEDVRNSRLTSSLSIH